GSSTASAASPLSTVAIPAASSASAVVAASPRPGFWSRPASSSMRPVAPPSFGLVSTLGPEGSATSGSEGPSPADCRSTTRTSFASGTATSPPPAGATASVPAAPTACAAAGGTADHALRDTSGSRSLEAAGGWDESVATTGSDAAAAAAAAFRLDFRLKKHTRVTLRSLPCSSVPKRRPRGDQFRPPATSDRTDPTRRVDEPFHVKHPPRRLDSLRSFHVKPVTV